MIMMTFLPPISRWTFLNDGAAASETVRPTSVEPVNETTRTASLASSALPTSPPPPVTRLTTPRRNPRLFENLDEVQRGERRQRRRLEDHGVAADQRRNDLPRRDRHREIPRRDDRADAERLADRHRELVAELRRHRLAVLAAPLARHEVGHVDRFLDVAPGLIQDLPHLAGHVARQRLLALGEELRGAEQQLRALRRRHQPPVLVGAGARHRWREPRRPRSISGTAQSGRRCRPDCGSRTHRLKPTAPSRRQ